VTRILALIPLLLIILIGQSQSHSTANKLEKQPKKGSIVTSTPFKQNNNKKEGDLSRDRARFFVKKHEGLSLLPKEDIDGSIWIGYGHNLDDLGIPKDIADQLLELDLTRVYAELDKRMPWWRHQSEVRKVVLVDMCYNLGINRFLGFKKMLAAVKEGNYDTAADEMLNSKWATQVKGRAVELAQLMREGVY
jgi:lysozyme